MSRPPRTYEERFRPRGNYNAGNLAKILANYPPDTVVLIESGRIEDVQELRSPEGDLKIELVRE